MQIKIEYKTQEYFMYHKPSENTYCGKEANYNYNNEKKENGE